MSRFWSPVVHTLSPYVPGEQPEQGRSSSSTPTRILTRRRRACGQAIQPARPGALRLYPDPAARRLRETIAARWCCSPGCSLAMVRTRCWPRLPALLEAPERRCCSRHHLQLLPGLLPLFGIRCEEVPLDGAMRIDRRLSASPCSASCSPNPTLPPALRWRASDRGAGGRRPGRLVVIDEAYVDFGAESAVPLVARHPQSAGRPDHVQVASPGRPASRLRDRQRPLIEALSG